jgi:hypothetical protein
MWTCPQCGTQVEPPLTVCQKCGTAASDGPASAPVPQPESAPTLTPAPPPPPETTGQRVLSGAKTGALLGALLGAFLAVSLWGTFSLMGIVPPRSWSETFPRVLTGFTLSCTAFMAVYGAVLGLIPRRKKPDA